ncbi:hypothetical protein FC15_GL001185 [Lapidilactobacillus concavus DSM 17758]|uniref:UPF0342 protein FC15_GL001185 n=2 Tax=Lapidilactobacillus TaxID=2767884 RepID=A0A0R1VZZ1_9LACO|nr:hypothetical protein FC15_GL001185 [Lapidilactobacillus concavus DSM 17758]
MMTINIYDNANEMATALRQTPEYTALKTAFAKMKADPVAYGLFQQMEKLQAEFQQKQASGQEISDDDIQKMRDFSGKLMQIDLMKDLMSCEQEMNRVMDELNQIVTKPITELYQD